MTATTDWLAEENPVPATEIAHLCRVWHRVPTERIRRVLGAEWERRSGPRFQVPSPWRTWNAEIGEECCPLGMAFYDVPNLPSSHHPEAENLIDRACEEIGLDPYGQFRDANPDNYDMTYSAEWAEAAQEIEEFLTAWDAGDIPPEALRDYLEEIVATRG